MPKPIHLMEAFTPVVDIKGQSVSVPENGGELARSLDSWLEGIADRIVQEKGVSEDEAFALLFKSIEALAAVGECEPLPEPLEPIEHDMEWLGKAQTYGLGGLIMDTLKKGASV